MSTLGPPMPHGLKKEFAEAYDKSVHSIADMAGVGAAAVAGPKKLIELFTPSSNRFGVKTGNCLISTSREDYNQSITLVMGAFRRFKDTEGQPIWEGEFKEGWEVMPKENCKYCLHTPSGKCAVHRPL